MESIIINILIASVLISVSSSLVGTFALLQRKSLVGDAIAHATLPGVCLSFLLAGEKNPFILILGALVTGWLSLLFIDFVQSKTKIKKDAILGITLSIFFALGIMLLTYMQHMPHLGNISGLSDYIFGNIVSVNRTDLLAFSAISLLCLIGIIALYKELVIYSFDESFAHAIGLKTNLIRFILSFLTILTIISNMQAIGMILTASMLITPAAAARFWTNKLSTIFALAIAFSILSSLFGVFISYHYTIPTGPLIVVFVSTIAILSFLFAPKKGIFSKRWNLMLLKRKVADENMLKLMFKLGEKEGNITKKRTTAELSLSIGKKKTLASLARLKHRSYVNKVNDVWQLTKEGVEKGKRITRLHRLWELYLTTHLQIAPDHVHEDAETIEHIITPELEKELEKVLGYPKVDPHEKEIPY